MLTIRPMGERALLIEVPESDEVLAVRAALAADPPAGVVQIVPAARTVLVEVDPAVLTLQAARAWILQSSAAPALAVGADDPIDIPVHYDGVDLLDLAATLHLSADALVAQHSAATWTVAFTGFAPGFGYLVSPDWPHRVPRLDSPRTEVPVGSVAVAAEFSGVYPRASPGGWRLLGRTGVTLFDPDAAAPALLTPGRAVRFRPVREVLSATERQRPRVGGDAVTVTRPSPLATLQDAGRPGLAASGIARSGALDRGALRIANRLLGNRVEEAAIEITVGGFRAVAHRDLWFAVTGAWVPVRLDGRPLDPYAAHAWPKDAELEIGVAEHGIRAYLAVRGGFDGPAMAGSVSTDMLAGLGPAPLRAGDGLGISDRTVGEIPAADLAPWGSPHDDEVVIEVTAGPREDWFDAASVRALYESVWTVTSEADRVGIRLDGPELVRARTGELPSEGMVPGALQVPPAGRPVVLQADGPVTGGYPVIAVATDASLDALAQVRPGTRVRFRHARR